MQLARFHDVDAWIQIACPRLSIDWGYAFSKVRVAVGPLRLLWNDSHIFVYIYAASPVAVRS